MKCIISHYTEFTLTLTQREAEWLHRMMQNPINMTLKEEGPQVATIRNGIFNALKPATRVTNIPNED